MNAPTLRQSRDLVRDYEAAPEAEQRRLDGHVLVQVLLRAAEYAISSEFHPEYAARASEDVPAARLRLWQEVCKFMAQPDEARASEITKLMLQIINATCSQRQDSVLALAMRRAVQLENLTHRERRLMGRYGQKSEVGGEID